MTLPRSLQDNRPLKAFSLTELLVAIALVAILALAAVTLLHNARENAAEVQCASNLRQLARGCLSFAQDHGGRLPSVREGYSPEGRRNTWMVQICPYVGVENYRGPVYERHMQKTIFWCPSDKTEWQPRTYTGFTTVYATKTSYLANNAVMDERAQDVDMDGVIGPRYLSNISHPAQTIMLMEGGRNLWAIVGYHNGAFSHFGGKRPDGWGYQSTPENVAGYHRGANFWAYVDGHIARKPFSETYGPGFNDWLADKP